MFYLQALLRVFVEHTSDDSEKRRLQELCSKQGSGDYTLYIREPSLSILDILHHFPSCHPPVERLIGKILFSLEKVHFKGCNKFKIFFEDIQVPRMLFTKCSPRYSSIIKLEPLVSFIY